ncbi:MAG: alcohol dehydrogenase catalytic domain-containing protein [Chitinophagaceae bacterium]|nr:alcohol dehydrogenase catalytic domain-containing protein [Chitinophagaceae bacterium]
MVTRSLAAITTGNEKFVIDEVSVDDPKSDEVLVAIKAAGLCHTDYDSMSWKQNLVMGHEGAGIVIKAGKKVKHVKEGDHVILNWAVPCGHCFQCVSGNEHLCENNSFVLAGNRGFGKGHAHRNGTLYKGKPIARSFNIGTLSEYTLVKSAAVVSISKTIPFPSASIVGCGVMTGFGSVINAARVQPSKSVVVLGCGGVGLNVIQGARIAGANPIIGIDTRETSLAMATKMGATHTLLAKTGDNELAHTVDEVKSLTNGRGADYAFECTARPTLGEAPLRLIRHGGMGIQVSGIEQKITFDMQLFEWDKIYLNPLYGKCRPQIDFSKIIDYYEHKKLFLDELVTKTYPLTKLNKAFEDMLSGKNAKGVIVFK